MKIALLETFYGGSHKQWADILKANSNHDIELFTLPDRHWKWRMHGGAVSLADQFNESSFIPDLILATDMLDLATFLALSRPKCDAIPTAIYFHENQLSYPWSPADPDVKLGRDNHYGFINYTSALAADKVFFNSEYHRGSFLEALTDLLKRFPDHNEVNNVELIRNKSDVLPLVLDLEALDIDDKPSKGELPLILWNHRWEFDKGPEEFFQVLFELQDEGLEFEVAVLGENYSKYPAIFDEAKERLGDRVVAWGFQENRTYYVNWLHKADILPVTSIQDFFGISLIEAMYCGIVPLVPDRLAYPEHFDERISEDFFYQTKDELRNKLRAHIQDLNALRAAQVPSVSRYSVQEIMPKYDSAFELIPDRM